MEMALRAQQEEEDASGAGGEKIYRGQVRRMGGREGRREGGRKVNKSMHCSKRESFLTVNNANSFISYAFLSHFPTHPLSLPTSLPPYLPPSLPPSLPSSVLQGHVPQVCAQR
jgi:hypothetical protein